jgi:U3 small nucleolar RNA-associated protein 10
VRKPFLASHTATHLITNSSSPDDSLACLTLLAEVLGAQSLPGSLDFVARLLETLGLIVQYQSQAQVDMSYLEQLFMTAVENAADNISVRPSLKFHAL